MATPIIYTASFFVTVKPEYVNYGVTGYMVGAQDFRSIASLTTALSTAFSKDFGTYRFLEVQIKYNKGNEVRQALCNADNYTEVLTSITADLEDEKMTLDDLLGE
jgi:hypothetical protein